MDFIDRLENLSKKLDAVSNNIDTEEATKNALIMPFLHDVLGYDVFNPLEVIPEFTADTGSRRAEKVDYALLKDGEVQILMECKRLGEKLNSKHAGQLFRYFSVTNARLAILTNGQHYQFYTDLDAPNKMDEKPFVSLDLKDIDDHIVPEVKKLTKSTFDIGSIVDAAGELKYLNQIKNIIEEQFDSPTDDFVKFFASRVHSGPITAKVRGQFLDLTHKALKQFIKDTINSRLKSVMDKDIAPIIYPSELHDAQEEIVSENNDSSDPKIVTTEEEMEGFNIVRAILRQRVAVIRIVPRDTQSYFGVLLDDNNRKPLCRLHFNAKQKYLGIFDSDKNESRIPIDQLDDIFDYSERLLETIDFYDSPIQFQEAN